jgi:hypothetical protein
MIPTPVKTFIDKNFPTIVSLFAKKIIKTEPIIGKNA